MSILDLLFRALPPPQVWEELGHLHKVYQEAVKLGDTSVCVPVTVAHMLGKSYAEVRERVIRDYNLVTPVNLLIPKTQRGKYLSSADITSEVWRRYMDLGWGSIPVGKTPIFDVQVWPLCRKWSKAELQDLTGVVIAHQPTSGTLHITPVVQGWALDYLAKAGRGIPIRLTSGHPEVEVVYAKTLEIPQR